MLIFVFILIVMCMWLTESNRPKHLKVGVLAYATCMIFFYIGYSELIFSSCFSTLIVAGLMMAVEYGQKTCGSKFDWLDVLAGCLVPLVLTAVFCVLYFII